MLTRLNPPGPLGLGDPCNGQAAAEHPAQTSACPVVALRRIESFALGALFLVTSACADTMQSGGDESGDRNDWVVAAPQGPQGLFECNLPRACTASQHAAIPSGWECVAELVYSGESGVVHSTDNIGGHIYITELLVLYLGDGTALSQQRHFECECNDAKVVWPTATFVQRCSVALSPAVSAECEMGSSGCWVSPEGTLSDCVQEPIPSCEEALAMLGP